MPTSEKSTDLSSPPKKRRGLWVVLGLVVVGAVALVAWRGSLIVPLGADRTDVAAIQRPAAGGGVPMEVTPILIGHSAPPRCGPAAAASCLETTQIVMGAYLVKHPKGTFLVDSGVSAENKKQDMANASLLTKFATNFEEDGTLKDGLVKLGSPRIDFVLITHAHYDHTGGLLELTSPRAVMAPGEAEFIKTFEGPNAREGGVKPRHFVGATLETFAWDGPAYEGYAKSHDWFGDGSVVLVPMAGHTPGSMGIFLNTVGGKRLLFIGDTAWGMDGVELPSHKLRLMSEMVDNDVAQVSDELWRLHHLKQVDPELVIVPAHDAKAMDQVRALARVQAH